MADYSHEPLLTPNEVAQMFRVDPKTVTRWAQRGRIQSVRTLGGHRRYFKHEVEALLNGGPPNHDVQEVDARAVQNRPERQK